MEKQLAKKMVLMLTAGVGMDAAEFLNVPVDMTEDELSTYAWEAAVQFAQSYGLEPEGHRSDSDEFEDEYGNYNYTNDIEGWFEEYKPEDHDGLVVGNSAHPTFRDL
jgi:hypothetical protein